MVQAQLLILSDDLAGLGQRQTTFANRVHWAKSYLGKAGLVELTKRAHFRITEDGRKVLASPPERIDIKYLNRFPSFQQFRETDGEAENDEITSLATADRVTTLTPDEAMRNAHRQLEVALADELMQRIRSGTPAFFESLVVRLLVGMGYGGSVTDVSKALVGGTGDGGVGGVIDQDQLGLDRIYVQAKRMPTGTRLAHLPFAVFSAVKATKGGVRHRLDFLCTSTRKRRTTKQPNRAYRPRPTHPPDDTPRRRLLLKAEQDRSPEFTTILFESSGGQTDKVAHLPELRFALGEPELDTTTIDNAAFALEDRSYFVRKAGSDGFRIGYQPTMKKVVSDRRASLDEETEIKPAMCKLIEDEFRRGASIPVVPFPRDGAEIPDTPRLTLIAADPDAEWSGAGPLCTQLAEWTRSWGKSPRLYPGALVWCLKKPGRDLRDKMELGLAWKRVAREVAEGTLGGEFDRNDRADLQSKVKDAEVAAKDEVWGDYRFAILADGQEADGLKVIDLGAGHSSSGETLCGRVIAALKSEALLNELVGAGYIERNWPPALKEVGAWPLASLRQSFLNGSLTRLVDPDATLKSKIVEFVTRGDFGLASGKKTDGAYDRMWFQEMVAPDEVAFEAGVFLLIKSKAQQLKAHPDGSQPETPVQTALGVGPSSGSAPDQGPVALPVEGPGPQAAVDGSKTATLRLIGNVPPEIWNRLGTKVLPKLRSGMGLRVGIDFSVSVEPALARNMENEIELILEELGLKELVRIERA